MFTLRTRKDAGGLAQRLAAGPQRVLVMGGGFTGSEIASACRERGLEVTVAERGPAPLVGALGGDPSKLAAVAQRNHGVDLRAGVTVTVLHGYGSSTGAELSDGSRIEAEALRGGVGRDPQRPVAGGVRAAAARAGSPARRMPGLRHVRNRHRRRLRGR